MRQCSNQAHNMHKQQCFGAKTKSQQSDLEVPARSFCLRLQSSGHSRVSLASSEAMGAHTSQQLTLRLLDLVSLHQPTPHILLFSVNNTGQRCYSEALSAVILHVDYSWGVILRNFSSPSDTQSKGWWMFKGVHVGQLVSSHLLIKVTVFMSLQVII